VKRSISSVLSVVALALLAVVLGGAGSGVCIGGNTLNQHILLALGARLAPDAGSCWVDVGGARSPLTAAAEGRRCGDRQC